VNDPQVRDFDARALFDALDAQRIDRGLTWRGVADELWTLSAGLNEQRLNEQRLNEQPRDHPISPATLTGLAKRGSTSCQHALFMLRWLGRTPESFLVGGGLIPGTSLPPAGSDRRLRWDLARLYEALDGSRREEQLTWTELARVLRCTPNQLTGIRVARFAIEMNLAMKIVQWLGRPAADFIYAAGW
jgi:hypothetical protein